MPVRVLTVAADDALEALRQGARRAVLEGLSEQVTAFERMAELLGRAYVFKEWLTPDEVAAYIGCDARTADGRAKAVRELHAEGLPYVVVGRVRLTRRADLDEYLAGLPRQRGHPNV